MTVGDAVCRLQVTPALTDVQIPVPTAIKLLPPESEATESQHRSTAVPEGVWSVQVAPPSVEVQMLPAA
jgi:hypothetical protein